MNEIQHCAISSRSVKPKPYLATIICSLRMRSRKLRVAICCSTRTSARKKHFSKQDEHSASVFFRTLCFGIGSHGRDERKHAVANQEKMLALQEQALTASCLDYSTFQNQGHSQSDCEVRFTRLPVPPVKMSFRCGSLYSTSTRNSTNHQQGKPSVKFK